MIKGVSSTLPSYELMNVLCSAPGTLPTNGHYVPRPERIVVRPQQLDDTEGMADCVVGGRTRCQRFNTLLLVVPRPIMLQCRYLN